MKCPVCSVELKIADRQGIEIDYCPQCRGIWLDRGELDKIIERSSAAFAPPAQQTESRPAEYEKYERDERDYRKYEDDYKNKYRYDDHYGKKKKKSFLDDIFDF
ncbi:MAG: zf-TFIIB domain-containing protein [Ignavibacteriaceae bacterium]|nr:zf-TFIIB domain-containing protein [Ignavibacteriaceae bacterium]NUM70972.1 zf-TFIIB domain-containing protein [Ignavibacteriaceae bacterium]